VDLSKLIRRKAGGRAFLLLALLCTSCARHYELAVPADVSQLPTRRGWNGNNVVAITPWQYLGSRYRTHEFRYHFNRDNAIYYREVSVARERTVLRFEERAFGDIREWVILQTDGQMFYFSLLSHHR
jgi:hypothetical protein